jgi:hypothetical protein
MQNFTEVPRFHPDQQTTSQLTHDSNHKYTQPDNLHEQVSRFNLQVLTEDAPRERVRYGSALGWPPPTRYVRQQRILGDEVPPGPRPASLDSDLRNGGLSPSEDVEIVLLSAQ